MPLDNLIQLEDIYEFKKRKQQELEFYKHQLDALLVKMSYVEKEVHMTEFIIEVIEKEKFTELKRLIIVKKNGNE